MTTYTTYAGRTVSVVGLGREGLAVARVLAGEGARVLVSDARDAATLAPQIAVLAGLRVEYSLGGNRPDEVLDCDMLVLSPGVDKRVPLVREAVRRGIPITSETALFFERCPAPIIGVTGSSGKTTTTTLIGAMLGGGARPVFVGGNIGRPLLERLGEIAPDAWVVLELSSFQLEWLRASPRIAVVTNLTPNHLDRHETMEAYVAAKTNILRHQDPDGLAVLNGDDPLSAGLAEQTRGRVLYFTLVAPSREGRTVGAYLDGDDVTLDCGGRPVVLCRVDEIQAPGRHNVANALAAAIVADACGIAAADIGAAIRAFSGVLHRLQRVAVVAGVAYYDDSIATSPERTRAALAALDAPVVLILGGRDKRLPWGDLARDIVRRCRGVALIGEAAGLIRQHIESALAEADARGAPLLARESIVTETSMRDAVARAARLARSGDAVALSPGCASYDMYPDYEERGRDFARVVGGLTAHV